MSFETINFDIVILIITFFSLIFGFYYGVSRRLKNLISFIIPFVLIHFFLDKLISAIEKNELVMSKWRGFISWLERNFSIPNYHNFYLVILVAVLVYLGIFIIIRLNFSAFKGEPIRAVLHKEKLSSRFVATGLSFISAYFINLLVLFLSVNIFFINANKPVTNILIDSSKKITYIGEYIEVKYALEEYQRLEEEINLINGEQVFIIYDDILELYKNKNNEIIKFVNNLEKDVNDYKALELLDEFVYYYNSYFDEKDKFHYANVVEKIEQFDLIGKLVAHELNIMYNRYDLEGYQNQINDYMKNDLEGFTSILKTVLEKDDFPEIYKFLKEYEKNPNGFSGDNLVYSVVVKRFPDLKNIEKISEKNVFVRTYLNDVVLNKDFRGEIFLQND